jgi:hypothetical protein
MGSDKFQSVASFEELTHTFVLSSKQHLSEVPKALVHGMSRQRRAHQKSRTGCENCKKRRVKVDSSPPMSKVMAFVDSHVEPVRQ